MTTTSAKTSAQTQQYEDNMRGVLYKNKQKTDAKHPNARGRAKIDDVWYWTSSWTQHARVSGEKYQSLAFTKMTDEEVQKYINNTNASQASNTTNNVQGSEQPVHETHGNQQAYQEYNADGSERPSNNAPADFDSDIPF